ncbi:MAG: Gfo/Idh/MocA family oxidoreductase [Firmicutes bacterium]|jgi:predicted dehydrogenase|nr:Gfo/Idh/MocA family oxidoreductase [Bacillota bacterium]
MALGFAVIGCGAIARMHLESIVSIPSAKLVAVADTVLQRAEAVSREFGCDAYTNYRKVLERPDVRVVCIITPSGARREIALEAAAAGKHIIVEKPVEITVDRVDDIIQACDRAGVVLSGIFQFRFKPAWKFVKRAIDDGRLGKLVLGDAYNKWFRTQEYYDSSGWRGTWALDGGGALMNQGIHLVDLLLWMMGDAEQVTAYMGTLAHSRIEVEDTAVAVVKFKNGALGVIEGTTSVFPGYPMKMELHGTNGTVGLQGDWISDWSVRETTDAEQSEVTKLLVPVSTQSTASDPKQTDPTWHRLQIQDVVESILAGREPSVTGREGRRSVELINAIYKSAREGIPVSLPLKPGPAV